VSYFSRGSKSAAPTLRMRVPVFAVGQTVYVAGIAGSRARVPLTDDAGTLPLANLGDGTAVSILGWRPRSATSARYQVRATVTGVEGWLSVENLRRTRKATPVVPNGVAPSATPRQVASKRA
jgi:hypothetical protein